MATRGLRKSSWSRIFCLESLHGISLEFYSRQRAWPYLFIYFRKKDSQKCELKKHKDENKKLPSGPIEQESEDEGHALSRFSRYRWKHRCCSTKKRPHKYGALIFLQLIPLMCPNKFQARRDYTCHTRALRQCRRALWRQRWLGNTQSRDWPGSFLPEHKPKTGGKD